MSACQGLCAQLRAGKHGPTRLTTAPGREAGGGKGEKNLNGAAVLRKTTSTELTDSFPRVPAGPEHLPVALKHDKVSSALVPSITQG